MYLVASIDWYSRAVLAWRLSNTMGGGAFCVEALDEAIARYGPLEIFNSDQGARFTSEKFTSVCSGAACKFRWTGKVAASTTSSSGDCGEV